jgi:hypothetical protein
MLSRARPELLDEHTTWGAGMAAQTTIPSIRCVRGCSALAAGLLSGRKAPSTWHASSRPPEVIHSSSRS